MSKLTWQYVAGIFDGEGYVGIQVGTKGIGCKWSISQSGKSGELLFSILKPWIEKQGVKLYLHGYQLSDRRFQYKWELSNHTRKGVTSLLKKLMPYLIVKKTKAEDIVRFLQLYPKLSGCRPGEDAKKRWETRISLYGPTGNKCGLYSRQIKKQIEGEKQCRSLVS